MVETAAVGRENHALLLVNMALTFHEPHNYPSGNLLFLIRDLERATTTYIFGRSCLIVSFAIFVSRSHESMDFPLANST